MKEIDVATHEAGHGIAAHALKVPITLLSVRAREDEAGRTRLDPTAVEDDMTAAQILVAGQLAEKRALGHLEAFNWFFADDYDAVQARHFAERIAAAGGCGGDVLEVRRLVEIKARSLLVSRWQAVEEVAAKLERLKTLTGDEVSRICLAEDARRAARSEARGTAPKRAAPRPRIVPSARERRGFEFVVTTEGS